MMSTACDRGMEHSRFLFFSFDAAIWFLVPHLGMQGGQEEASEVALHCTYA